MSSLGDLTRALRRVEHCHFPGLAFNPVSSSQPETLEIVLTLPKILRPGSTTEHFVADNLWKFAFVLLLKAYVRADGVSGGLVYQGSTAENGQTLLSSTAHILTASFDPGATLSENCQNVSTILSTSWTPEMLKKELHLLEAETGSRPFNTTLYLVQDHKHEYLPDDDLGSGFILCIGPYSKTTAKDHRASIKIIYKTDFLDKWSAENVLATFQTILEIAAVDMECPLKRVNLISARDTQIIRSWNSRVPTCVHQTLNNQFEKTFSENADVEAVYTTEGSFTYRDLDDLSTVLAFRLMKAGVKPNTVVPIFMGKSRWSICGIASVWKAGGAVATMDPAYPDERLFAIIEEFNAKVIITDPCQLHRFKKINIQVIADVGSLPSLLEAEGLPVS